MSDKRQMMREEWIGGGGGLQRFASGFLLSGAEIYNSKPRAVEEGSPTTIAGQLGCVDNMRISLLTRVIFQRLQEGSL